MVKVTDENRYGGASVRSEFNQGERGLSASPEEAVGQIGHQRGQRGRADVAESCSSQVATSWLVLASIDANWGTAGAAVGPNTLNASAEPSCVSEPSAIHLTRRCICPDRAQRPRLGLLFFHACFGCFFINGHHWLSDLRW